VTELVGPSFQESLAKGIELFNRREFYEAHEAWEEGWIDELSDSRVLLQGLIQVAAGFYKLQCASPIGTVKLLELGLAKLRPFVGNSLGVDLEALLGQVERWLARAKQLVAENRADFDPSQLPRIRYIQPGAGDSR
jgi:predicted metal-dependent hydrolase